MTMNIQKQLIGGLSALALGLFMAGPVHAADVMDQPSHWDGFYFGGYGGANYADAIDGDSSEDYRSSDTAYTAGLQAGVNFDSGAYVWGIEADAGFGGLEYGDRTAVEHGLVLDGLFSVRGRLGMKVSDHLIYATAGLGILVGTAQTSSDIDEDTTQTELRPVVGIGVESFVTQSISIKAEGLMFIGDDRFYYDDSKNDGGDLEHIFTARLGVNFHF